MFRTRLSLNRLEDRSNPSSVTGLDVGEDPGPPNPYDPNLPPAETQPPPPATTPTPPPPGDGIPPVVDPIIPPYGT